MSDQVVLEHEPDVVDIFLSALRDALAAKVPFDDVVSCPDDLLTWDEAADIGRRYGAAKLALVKAQHEMQTYCGMAGIFA